MADFEFTWPLQERRKIRQTIRVLTDGIKDMRPVWKIVIPNLRAFHSKTFRRQADPFTRKQWTPLSEAYAERKAKLYGGKRILEASGAMRRAASKKGARGQVIVMTKKGMIFGVDLGKVYPLVHQLTSRVRKDGAAIRRAWFGVPLKDLVFMIDFAIQEVFYHKFKRVGGARVRRAA